jgi:hypothetical protein
MICAITTPVGTFHTEGTPLEVKGAIDTGAAIRCWYYMVYGKKVIELMWFDPDEVKMIREESEAHPSEEL